MRVLIFLWSLGVVGFGLYGLYELMVAVSVLFEAEDE